MKLKELKDIYVQNFGEDSSKEIFYFHSPGRVNLIGEHIDYNGGLVFPCALDFGTYGLARKRDDNKVNLISTNFELKVSVDLKNIKYEESHDWANYPKGVIKIMQDKGFKVGGVDILVSGDIPNGAGLSSSASLEVLIAYIINILFNNKNIPMLELVKISQKAENDFVGVNCGIMDQFAVGMGKEDKAILLNCNTLEYNYADLDLKDYKIVLMNTNKRRSLNDSKYNERRLECDKVLDIIKQKRKFNNLCEISKDEFYSYGELLNNEILKKRAKHVIYENERVKEAYKSLNKGNLKRFGELLIESHNSLKDLYEVTGKELDTIVNEALKVKGCIGARMTGAGFGGCAIAIVNKNDVNEFIDIVRENYSKKIGYDPSFYLSDVGNGTRQIIVNV